MSLSNKSVLIAGAGYVSRPVGDILVKNGVKVTFGCRTLESAEKLAKSVGPDVKAITLDVRNKQQMEESLKGIDLVVSLVPPPDHPNVLAAAIKNKTDFLSTSYISPEMEALGAQAKEAGIQVMNELGLDPGLDHLWAVKCLEEITKAGGKCTSFESFCGGLPAPECSNNPLGYKFSWSSSGVLRALTRVAKYYENGKELNLSGVSLMDSAKTFPAPHKGFAFECYANGDSLPYRHRYGSGLADATTIVRGTLRYKGYSSLCRCFIQLGLISMDEQDFLKKPISWAEATAKILGSKSTSESDLLWAISSKADFADTETKTQVIDNLRKIGIFSKDIQTVPQREASPFFTLCARLEQTCNYEKGERDLVYLQHTFHVEKKDGSKSILTASLVDYGNPEGYSSMARLVGTPCAVGALAMLRGDFKDSGAGFLSCLEEKIAAPLRTVLEKEYGITLEEEETAII